MKKKRTGNAHLVARDKKTGKFTKLRKNGVPAKAGQSPLKEGTVNNASLPKHRR